MPAPLPQLKEETLRIEEKEKDAKERHKAKKEHEQNWEKNRDQRVTGWHDYLKGGGNKKSTGMLKPPKLKTNDDVSRSGRGRPGRGRWGWWGCSRRGGGGVRAGCMCRSHGLSCAEPASP